MVILVVVIIMRRRRSGFQTHGMKGREAAAE